MEESGTKRPMMGEDLQAKTKDKKKKKKKKKKKQ
jgi:hypothetical protein